MDRPVIDKELLWKNFNSRMSDLQKLQRELNRIESKREDVFRRLEAEKKFVEQLCGMSWEDAQNILTKPQTNESGQEQKSSTKPKVFGIKKDSIPWWVLRAIVHYEDTNSQSRIDSKSIKIFIDAQSPGLLDKYSKEAIFKSLYELRRRRLINKSRGRSGKGGSQYCLTPLGREMLKKTLSAKES